MPWFAFIAPSRTDPRGDEIEHVVFEQRVPVLTLQSVVETVFRHGFHEYLGARTALFHIVDYEAAPVSSRRFGVLVPHEGFLLIWWHAVDRSVSASIRWGTEAYVRRATGPFAESQWVRNPGGWFTHKALQRHYVDLLSTISKYPDNTAQAEAGGERS